MEAHVEQAFFSLLQAGIWDRLAGRSCFPLAPGQWKAVYELSRKQTVEALVFDGIQKLDSRQQPGQQILLPWLVRVEKIAQRNRKMDAILVEQARFFSEIRLEPVLLKGQGLAHCYPNPERRLCGDIDWYFNSREAYQRANDSIGVRGMQVHHTPGFSSIYLWKGCEVEHHRRLIDLSNPFTQGFLRKIERAQYSKLQELRLGGVRIGLLSPVMQCLQVSAHILKHMLSYGVGIRQLCDLARLYYTHQEAIDGAMLQGLYRRVGIDRWVDLLHDALQRFLALPSSALPYPPAKGVDSTWMMQDILRGGNFGFFEEHPQGSKAPRSKRRVLSNIKKYYRLVPAEAISFPLVHWYSRWKK